MLERSIAEAAIPAKCTASFWSSSLNSEATPVSTSRGLISCSTPSSSFWLLRRATEITARVRKPVIVSMCRLKRNDADSGMS